MNYIRIFTSLFVSCMSVWNVLEGQQVFDVNLNDRSDNTFKVTVHPEVLSATNNVYQFASTAPGTYEVMDIGRFVGDFKAFDQSGKEVPTVHSSINEWTLSRPSDIRKITYTVADIWKAKVAEHPIYPMASSTIADDFVMLNGQAVFGYFSGMQTEPIRIKLSYPAEWKVGTALALNREGYYEAEDFDTVVDSPFFLGNLTIASTTVGGASINVWTYSHTGMIRSEEILTSLSDILKAESDFTHGLPVDHYAFLFYFGEIDGGAWEHSYSSEYVLKEDTLNAAMKRSILSTVAHEFFHVNIPLNLHSELVEHFNFAQPVMSQHLWLYEGTTEWATYQLQLRDSLITLDQYLSELQGKLTVNDRFDQTLSLTSLGIHSTEMANQYYNIYAKGAVVSTLLDIRLLELSGGRTGLRELLIRLSKVYGKKHAFSEANFFDTLTIMTYPEIGDFINRYIKGADKLPVKEYFGWLGIQYDELGNIDSSKSALRIAFKPNDTTFTVERVYPDSKSGLVPGDIIRKIDDSTLTAGNVRKLLEKISSMKPGSAIKLTVQRGNTEMEVVSVLVPRRTPHKFTVMRDPSADQKALRDAWMK